MDEFKCNISVISLLVRTSKIYLKIIIIKGHE